MKPVDLTAGKLPALATLGIKLELLASRHQTNGQWSCLLYTAPPHFAGPPPHYHRVLEEGFYVLEGTLTLLAGEETLELPAGHFMLVPPGMLHTFSNRSAEPVKMLCLFSPGGFEEYFEELDQLLQENPGWPPKDPARMEALQLKYDTHFPVASEDFSGR